jgi:protein-S-isoprenylcysteine O-methyltransferase Ste14
MATIHPATAPSTEPSTSALLRRRVVQLAVYVLVQAAILFLVSGRPGWTNAWVYLGCYVGLIALTALVVRDPELFAERARIRRDVKWWDKVIGVLFGIFGLGLLAVAALEARLAWSPPMPTALALAGLIVFVLGFGLSTWAMAANRFFSSQVRIQIERGHTVATGGPYRFVRHPGYVGFIVGALGSALLLGSRWALLPAALSAALVVVRTALEDRTLRAELPGYPDYAARVQYRLVPRVW